MMYNMSKHWLTLGNLYAIRSLGCFRILLFQFFFINFYLYLNFVGMLLQLKEIQKIMMHYTIGHWFFRSKIPSHFILIILTSMDLIILSLSQNFNQKALVLSHLTYYL